LVALVVEFIQKQPLEAGSIVKRPIWKNSNLVRNLVSRIALSRLEHRIQKAALARRTPKPHGSFSLGIFP
jgi:hypothetical protein